MYTKLGDPGPGLIGPCFNQTDLIYRTVKNPRSCIEIYFRNSASVSQSATLISLSPLLGGITILGNHVTRRSPGKATSLSVHSSLRYEASLRRCGFHFSKFSRPGKGREDRTLKCFSVRYF